MQTAGGTRVKTLNLALQGGGSHGAFTWGVLDTLLADRRIALEGLSGASAGALNAVALAGGWAGVHGDPRVGARETLARVWDEIGSWGSLGAWQARLGRALWGGGTGAGRTVSPAAEGGLPNGLRIGMNVQHAKFGFGVIVAAEGRGADARVQVNFMGGAGMKWLALEYAKLTPA